MIESPAGAGDDGETTNGTERTHTSEGHGTGGAAAAESAVSSESVEGILSAGETD